MGKTIFVSNRLPITMKKRDDGFSFEKSIGGLATGLSAYHEASENVWVGWPGITSELVTQQDWQGLERTLRREHHCLPVPLSERDVDRFYYGFCNETIWPLFHYFIERTQFNEENWQAYQRVNRLFFDRVAAVIEPGDTVWIHDYQLMLLPELIKEALEDTRIGFFLHIPFPSYEMFRLMVWREEILNGLMGADLIGFHTFDYVRHFLSSVRRILGHEHSLHQIECHGRSIKVDAFPMGIDYDRFSKHYDTQAFQQEVERFVGSSEGEQVILSVDRLDYTKGIPERLKAFDAFLADYPEYREKVRLHMIVAPSRVGVAAYDRLRSEITELVSEINGKYGTLDWMPVWFYFQAFSQEELIALYRHSDVLLVTPLRDGMNLVSKEYIAARSDRLGMVVISETAGAASELGEAVVVNANDIRATARGIKRALEMPDEEKRGINDILTRRLKRNHVTAWAERFLETLDQSFEASVHTALSLERDATRIVEAYRSADTRLIFLDYDGTLVGFQSVPQQAKPDIELKQLLFRLIEDPGNTVVLISGRDPRTLEEWLGDLRMAMIASHGLWQREQDGEWKTTLNLDNSWKERVMGIMQLYVDRMPGALIEEKEYSLAFHYRQCEPDMVAVKLGEVRSALASAIQSRNLSIEDGKKVLEIKDDRVDKGLSASGFLQRHDASFILGVGDDRTDEDLFRALPEQAHTIKIGSGPTCARYRLKSWRSMRRLLKELTRQTDGEVNP